MQVKGKVTHVLEKVSGQSAKGPWSKQDFVIETQDQYPKHICFTVWNDKIPIPQIGQEVDVSSMTESREYNGRWFTDLTAWKYDAGKGAATSQQAPANEIKEQPSNEDGLPF